MPVFCYIKLMNKSALQEFVEKVMGINVDYAGMGGASAGIIGGSSTNSGVVQELRKNTIAFASEYSKEAGDPTRLDQSAQQLKGSFLALKMINAISEERLDELVSALDSVLKARGD